MFITVSKILIAALVLVLLYLLSIMPRMSGRPDLSPFDTRLFAHRGLHDNASGAPENSMPAFRKAVERGFGIELDVQTTKDGVPVVFHDFTLRRACGAAGKVCDYTYEQLQGFTLFKSSQRIPTLEEFLGMVQGQVSLIIEFKAEYKDMTVCRKADPVLRAYAGSYCIESFNPLVLFWFRKHHPEVMRGQLSDGFTHLEQFRGLRRKILMFPLQFLNLNFLSKPDFIAYNCKYENNISRRLCRKLFRSKAAAWTIKNEEQLSEAAPHFDVYIFDSFIPMTTLEKS